MIVAPNRMPGEEYMDVSVLVLGIGNLFMTDDAVGVKLVQRLQKEYSFPQDVAIVDGGTMGISLLPVLEGTQRLLVVDAIEKGHSPGTLIRLDGHDVPIGFRSKISISQAGVEDLLAASKLIGKAPREVVILGVQPAVLEWGTDLSPIVEDRFDRLLERVLEELTDWGVTWTLISEGKRMYRVAQ